MKSYTSPIPEPNYGDYRNYAAIDEKYFSDMRVWLKENGWDRDKHAGELVRFPMADGYALYMVAHNGKSMALFHCIVGDAWSIPLAHMRGIRVSDIRNEVIRAKNFAKLFARK